MRAVWGRKWGRGLFDRRCQPRVRHPSAVSRTILGRGRDRATHGSAMTGDGNFAEQVSRDKVRRQGNRYKRKAPHNAVKHTRTRRAPRRTRDRQRYFYARLARRLVLGRSGCDGHRTVQPAFRARYRLDLRPSRRGLSARRRATAHAAHAVDRGNSLLCGHALFHFWEVAVGICTPDVLPRDFPAVTLPALIGIGLSVWAYRQSRAGIPAYASTIQRHEE